MLNQALKVSAGTCQQFLEVLSKSVRFFFGFSILRWKSLWCSLTYIGNFLTNHLVKEFWKSPHNCQSY